MEKSAKIILNTIISYLFLAVVFIFLFSAICVVYNICMTFVAGQRGNLFNVRLFIYYFIKVLPIVLVLSAFYMPLYILRHYSTNVATILVYFALALSAFFFLIPLSFKAEDKMESNFDTSISRENISSGYFRTSDDLVILYSSVDEENSADGVCLNLSGSGKEVFVFDNLNLAATKEGFSDTLIEKNVEAPLLIKVIVVQFGMFISNCRSAISNGLVAWLCFFSMAFALVSIVCLRHLSKWRLVNVIMMMVFYILIFEFNVLVPAGLFLPELSKIVCSWFKFVPEGINSFLVIMNVLVAVIMIGVGLYVRNRTIKEGVE